MNHDITGGGSVEGDTTEPEGVALAHVPHLVDLEEPEAGRFKVRFTVTSHVAEGSGAER